MDVMNFYVIKYFSETHLDCKTETWCMNAGMKYFIDLKIIRCISGKHDVHLCNFHH